MIELLILACVAVVALVGLLAFQAHAASGREAAWRAERRFLIDRVIASHVGEVIALEREDTRKAHASDDTDRSNVRPLLAEGL